MKPADNIERQVKANPPNITTNKDTDQRILEDAFGAMDDANIQCKQDVGNTMLHRKIKRMAVAASVVLAIGLFAVFFDRATSPAWAIEQTIEAIANLDSATLHCEFSGKPNIFTLKIKRQADSWKSFSAYAESDELVGVIIGSDYYHYRKGSKEIYTCKIEDLANHERRLNLMKMWQEMVARAEWIAPLAPTLFHAAKLIASDWKEITVTDAQTGSVTAVISGKYKPLGLAFEASFDVVTKLLVSAKVWDPDAEKKGQIRITVIEYNAEIPDDIFDLEKATGAKLIKGEESQKRWDMHRKAHSIEPPNWQEALTAMKELYETYPDFINTPEAINYAGWCHTHLGQYDEAMQCYQKVIEHYKFPEWAVADAWQFKAYTFKKMGENEKAIEAFGIYLDMRGKKLEGQELTDRFNKHIKCTEDAIEQLKKQKVN